MKRIIPAAILIMCLSALSIFAQDTTGKLVGSVAAPDGAIPGATIVVTDNQTKKERTVTSSESGTFDVSQLEFGTYTVRITATGYKTFVANDVKIDAGREYPLNAKLEVGQVTEEITVTAGQESINSTNGELSNTVSTQQIRELPLNTRNALGLLNLQAGVNATTNSINGQRSSSTAVTRDGLNVQDNFIRTGTFVSDQPTVDDVSEFTITTQNAGADQGGGSSLVQLVTPRGGKDLHGALYEFNRNSEFAANTFFNNTNNVARPFLNRNQYGGSISGSIPFFNFGEGGSMFKKDKLFFFGNYEAFRLAQQASISSIGGTALNTLLPQARNGDFTYIGTDGVTRTVNVLTGAGFNLTGANATTFANAGGALTVDPIIQSRLLANLPTSGNAVTTGINYLQQVTLLRNDPRTRNSYTSRFDYDINDKNSLNFVYRFNDDTDARTDQAAGFSPNAFVNTKGPTNFFTGAYRLTLGGNFSNEFRAGYQKSGVVFDQGRGTPTDFLIAGLPFTSPEGTFFTQGRNTFYQNVQDNAVYSRGNHSFRFGVQIENQEVTSLDFRGVIPTFTISTTTNPNTPALTSALLPGVNTTDLGRANALRYTLAGIVGSGSRTANLVSASDGYNFGPSIFNLNYQIYSGYITDQWRFRSNLTLNLGLRYEYYTPLNNPERRYLEPVFPNPDDISSVAATGGVLNFIGTNTNSKGNFFNPDKDNLAPSFSFAYSPKFEKGLLSRLTGGNTVIRGGFRINYLNDEYLRGPDAFDQSNSGLGAITVQSNNLRSALTPRDSFSAVPSFNIAPAFSQPPRSFLTNNTASTFLGSVFGVDPNYQMPRIYEWNVGIQREIGFKNVLEIRYVGSRGNQMIRSIDQNEIELVSNGFLRDFQIARNNCTIQGRTLNPTAFDPAFFCTNAGNTGLPGQQNLTVFNNLAGAGNLTNATNLSFIQAGRVGSLAQNYISLRQQGTVPFQKTSDIFSLEILTNGGKYRFNALQIELRRRFNSGWAYQVNYTFQKTLADIPDDSQVRQSPYQDNDNPGLQYGRPDYDRTHTVNANMIFELPFGKGKRFLNKGGWVDKVFGGFQFSSIVNLSSGPPLGVIDPRSTAATTTRSSRQSARTSLTTKELKDLTGVFKTPNGIYFVNPKVLFALGSNGQRVDLNQPLPAGVSLVSVRATSPLGTAPFAEQVFFFNEAGQVGNLPRNFINGLPYFNMDAAFSKNIRFSETMRLQLRLEAFNLFNNQPLNFGTDLNIDSTSFSRVTSTFTGTARVVQFGARFDF